MITMNQAEHTRAERTKKMYPKGTKVEVILMNDPYPIPAGTKGTVVYVDDMGDIHVEWDNGRTLSLVPGEDDFKVIG